MATRHGRAAAMLAAAALAAAGAARADTNLAIVAFRDGCVTWTNVDPALYYSLEWRPSLDPTNVWRGSYDGLRDVRSAAPAVTVPVPVFYRVAGRREPGAGPAPVPATGQTAVAPTNPAPAGSDGALRRGAPWPAPRFTDPGNGTVIDNLTGLVWLQNAGAFTFRTWSQAVADCAALQNGAQGLSDGSAAGDWRMPNVREILSLIDFSRRNPAVPAGHPFLNLPADYFWSGSIYAGDTAGAWAVNLWDGGILGLPRDEARHVLPVRGGP